MAPKPTSEELEKRIAELENQVAQYQTEKFKNPLEIFPALLEAFQHIPLCKTFEDAAKKIFDQCKKLTGARSGYVALLSENGEENEVLFLDAGGMPCDVDPDLPMPIRGLREIAFKTKEVAYDNAFSESPWMKYMPQGHVRLDNVLFAPLNVADRTVGIIGIANKPGGFNDRDFKVASAFGKLAAVALTYANSQEALRESEKQYRSILKTAMDGFWLTDTEGRILEVNDSYCSMSGYSKDELLSMKICDLEALEDSKVVTEHMQKLFEKSSDRFESKHRPKDGTIIDVEVSVQYRPEEGGRCVCFLRDITERKKAEKRLKESKIFLDNISDIAYRADDQGNLVWVNSAGERITGLSRDDLIGKPFLPLFIEADHPSLLDVYKRTLMGESLETILTFESGVTCHFTSLPDLNENGDIIGNFGIARDITERLMAENALKTSEARLKKAQETAKIGNWEYDISTGKVWGSEETFRIYEIERKSEILPLDEVENCIIDAKRVNQALVDLITKNEAYDIEFQINSKAREGLTLIHSIADLVCDADGNPVKVQGVIQDITDYWKIEEERRQSEETYRNLLKNLNAGVVVHAPDTSILMANTAACNLLGLSEDQMLGKEAIDPWWKFLRDDGSDMPLDEYPVNQVLFTNEPLRNLVIGVKTPQKDDHAWLLANGYAVLKDSGQVEQVIISFIDITELKKAEGALRQSEKNLKESQRIAHLGSWRLDLKTNQVEWTEELYNMYGFDPTLPPPPYTEHMKLFTPESWEKLSASLDRTKATGIPYELELETVREDGSSGWMWVRGEAEKDSKDTIIALWGAAQDITERKRIELALKESEERFKALHNASFGGIAIHDKGLILECNQGLSEITGYEYNELMGMNGLSLISDDTRNNVIQNIDAGYEKPYEVIGVRRNGEKYPLRLEARNIPYKEKKVRVVEFRDITENKWAEKALRESEEKFRLTFNSSPDAVNINRLQDGLYVEINDGFTQLTGYTYADVTSKTSLDINIWQNPADRVKLTQKLRKKGVCDNLEAQFRKKDGSLTTALMSARVISLNGEPHIISITRDISERKQAEAERERLLLAIEQANEIVAITDASGIIQYVNPAFEKITGFSSKEAIGENPRILKSGHHNGAFYKGLWDTILSGNPWAGRLTNKRKNSTLYTGECSISPVKDENGRVVNFVWISRDITNELELQKRVSQAQKMEAIGALAGGIAHDFNNILYPIIGFSEMLMEDLPTGSPERENVEVIFKAAKRAGDLVKQILSFSCQAEHEKMPVRIQHILKEVLKLTRSTIPSSIDIIQSIQADCGIVMADPTQLHQIAMNLITNSYHAVEESGGSISIQLKESILASEDCTDTPLAQGHYAVMSITDNGCGIDPANMGKIFEPFFSTKEQGKGTGLGLSVVYGIVKDCGGDVRVYSETGKGTTFTVYLPIIKKDAEPISTEELVIYETGTERILLVDDEEPIVQMEKQMLERLGYHVEEHTSSIEALKAFRTNSDAFDLVITDMNMPNMSGDKLAGKLRSIKPGIPVIICTGFSVKIDAQKAKAIGVNGCLIKPVVKSDLAKMVRKVLDEAKG